MALKRIIPALLFCGNLLLAAQDIEFVADEYVTNFDTQMTVARGNVVLDIGGKTLKADHVDFDEKGEAIVATGNVFYKNEDVEITGEKVEIDLQTGFGRFHQAIFKKGKQFSIEARLLSHYEKNKYVAEVAKLSSCVDCPPSWSMTGAQMKVEVEEYAEIHHAIAQIRDVPVAYFPIFFVPVKSKRQSGFLAPSLFFGGELGTGYGIPYFFNFSDSLDSTLKYEYRGQSGHRLRNEWRYVYSNRSFFNGIVFGVKDNGLTNEDSRFGSHVNNRTQLTPNLVQRFRGEFATDERVSEHFEEDFQSTLFPTLTNEISLSWQNYNHYLVAMTQFHRDNLVRDDEGVPYSNINLLPYGVWEYPSFSVFEKFRSNLEMSYINLDRTPLNGVEEGGLDSSGWIRTGQRLSLLYNIDRPTVFNYFSYRPKVEWRFDQYAFSQPALERDSNLYPQRLRFYLEQKVETQFFRVFSVESDSESGLRAVRHSLKPFLLWSHSPPDWRPNHPFFNDEGAPRFDLFDPNSDAGDIFIGDSEIEDRLRHHHLLSFGLTTDLVGRFGDKNRNYVQFARAQVIQRYDLMTDRLGKLLIDFLANRWGLSLRSTIKLDLNSSRKTMNIRSSAVYSFSRYKLIGQQVISEVDDDSGIDRISKITAGVRASNLGNWSLSTYAVYDNELSAWYEQKYIVEYNSPSKCWFFGLSATQRPGSSTGRFTLLPQLEIRFDEGASKSFSFN